MISFDKVVGVHENALYLRNQRLKTLSDNLANSDTPHYKAKDFNFNQALKNATAPVDRDIHLSRTNKRHIKLSVAFSGIDLKYRNPFQPALDGNTVELEVEQAKFAENAMRYQATLSFLGKKFSGIKNAFKDE
ncbi:flagellar biosynthesis protein FlgB [Piscirickettsia salmonis]|uniref:flagellar basal body rod protein FlgB n=1 Tax=Piscirickettsia salmonis TaxID=1238 RepID=UPI0002F3A1F7|nr:flagellar basal body rod protein FlgB [Piscirickettsia salmonis]RNC78517.1 flagellar basal body rod protein FlgB [Piscirickettsiaceae bacterium NZ-RLO2]ALA25464.1 flagellar basal-body rod protein FlgB [Piscirickettsia salmonis]APS42980.1 flagellar biosynthesis protein FlgB [Piscirickettsia salmonis]APS46328.1 flagellar biosynthesis protein FlgB [Piscirickettsia salmonis]APS50279.1 flagellar biosynthesis protein FlgB [Piscirickettsia salmonis]